MLTGSIDNKNNNIYSQCQYFHKTKLKLILNHPPCYVSSLLNNFEVFNFTISTIIINYQATKILFLNDQKHTTLPNNSKQVNNREEKKNRTCLPANDETAADAQLAPTKSEAGRMWAGAAQVEIERFRRRM